MNKLVLYVFFLCFCFFWFCFWLGRYLGAFGGDGDATVRWMAISRQRKGKAVMIMVMVMMMVMVMVMMAIIGKESWEAALSISRLY